MLFSLKQCNLDTGKPGVYRFINYDCLYECYLQRIEHISIIEALYHNLVPKTFKRFLDDSNARFNTREQSLQFLDILFNTREQSLQFLDILNSQDPSI